MELDETVGRRSRKIFALLGAAMLLTALHRETLASSQNQVARQPASAEPLVIQGRITAIQGTLVTVKLPDGYPGAKGVRAQFVTAGSTFRVDVSHARVLLPDGKQTDKFPLAVGDPVLMILTGSAEPGRVSPTYSASIVERIIQGDRVITH